MTSSRPVTAVCSNASVALLFLCARCSVGTSASSCAKNELWRCLYDRF